MECGSDKTGQRKCGYNRRTGNETDRAVFFPFGMLCIAVRQGIRRFFPLQESEGRWACDFPNGEPGVGRIGPFLLGVRSESCGFRIFTGGVPGLLCGPDAPETRQVGLCTMVVFARARCADENAMSLRFPGLLPLSRTNVCRSQSEQAACGRENAGGFDGRWPTAVHRKVSYRDKRPFRLFCGCVFLNHG